MDESPPEAGEAAGVDLLSQVRDSIQSILALPISDTLSVDYVLSVCLANTWSAEPEPVWGYLVGPPGSAKTELLRTLDGWTCAHAVDELTENALASGHESEEGEDPSLLPQLHGKVLVIKDFSSFTGQSAQSVTKVLSVLRSAYDGSYAKASGKAGARAYVSKFGVLVATTPVVDEFMSEHQRLGERFLMFRVSRTGAGTRQSRTARLSHVRARMEGKNEWRAALRGAVQDTLQQTLTRVRPTPPSRVLVPPEVGETIDNVADLTCRLRTSPHNERPTDAEFGGRLVQQFTNLLRARASLSGRAAVGVNDLLLLRRVAEDTLPLSAHHVFRVLYGEGQRHQAITSDQLSDWSGVAKGEVLNLMRQWSYLGVVARSGYRYRLSADSAEQTHLTGMFSSPGADALVHALPSEEVGGSIPG